MEIRIDPELCQGHTLCYGSAPDLVDLREDDGHAFVRGTSVPEHLREAALHASAGCPEGAITLTEDRSPTPDITNG